MLGAIDLDPASSEHANTVVKAARFFTRRRWVIAAVDGSRADEPAVCATARHAILREARRERDGRRRHRGDRDHEQRDRNGVFHDVGRVAIAVCFPPGRVRFWQPNTTHETGPLQGQAVIYTGPDREAFCRRFADIGLVLVRPSEAKP